MLGHGATARVFRAQDQATGREVAVKEIPAELGLERRVGAEIRAASRLGHPGVVALLDWGEERDAFYLVSELVEGPSLDRLMDGGWRGGDRAAVECAADVLEALDHAHGRGVVHRDVKPANVLMGPDGRARLTDFGVARLAGEHRMTMTGQVIGTMAYMAPEQAAGERAGEPADVFAASLLLYEALTGANPLMAVSPVETARRAAARDIPPLARVRPDLPTRLVRAVEAGLARDPDRRPAPADLARVLRAEAGGLGEGARSAWPTRMGRLVPPLAAAGAAGALAGWAADQAGRLPGWGALGVGALAAALAWLRPGLAAFLGVVASAALVARDAPALGALVLAGGIALLLLGRGSGRAVLLPAAAPPLFAMGLGPLYALLAGRVRGTWARLWAATTGVAVAIAWQVGAGSGDGLLFGSRPVRSAADALAGEASPLAAAERVWAPLRDRPEVLAAAVVMVAFSMLVPLLARARGDGPRLVWALGWIGSLAVVQAVIAPDPLAVLVAFLPSAILVAAWAARPWRVVMRRDPGHAAPASGTAG
jgi:hypothetical protein